MKIIFLILSYLLGAVPTGYLLVKMTARKDIREVGSGSTGATNVLRYRGWKTAIPVLLFDFLKGFIPALLASQWLGDQRLAWLALVVAVTGHCFPVFIKFKGGKGVATSLGGFLYFSPLAFIIILIIIVMMIAIFRYVSLATLTGLLVYSPLTAILEKSYLPAVAAFLIFLLVLSRHHENIRRLLSGAERKIGEKLNG
ncbi:MAG: glycerol-3-phosphate 1-O-acyltransferase PlsY [Acidobacteriota bacterium]|nr:glycerol-3-phosphate 1-O-acyltransferase PlsY [Acidobacteriota bacterium]